MFLRNLINIYIFLFHESSCNFLTPIWFLPNFDVWLYSRKINVLKFLLEYYKNDIKHSNSFQEKTEIEEKTY
jgi:hypothetical protein